MKVCKSQFTSKESLFCEILFDQHVSYVLLVYLDYLLFITIAFQYYCLQE